MIDSFKLVMLVLIVLSIATFFNTKSMQKQLEDIKVVSEYEDCNKLLGMALEENGSNIEIVDVVSNTPAERAGILNEDVLISIDGKKISSCEAVREYIKSVRTGEKVTMEIQRKDSKDHLLMIINPQSLTSIQREK